MDWKSEVKAERCLFMMAFDNERMFHD